MNPRKPLGNHLWPFIVAGKLTDLRRNPVNKAEGLRPIIAFYIFIASGLFAAFFSPIQDCDEVFNYWEPSHYLNHGYGLQTWEYSPVYAIRSWTYAGIHSIIIALTKLVPFVNNKSAEFYFLRIVFAFVCAACQSKLFSVVSRSMNPRIAIIFLIISITSPGMFHASTAYLPSSFAMYATMLGTAAFMNWKGGMRTAQGIMWFGIGATLGWPFAAALAAPFIAEEIFVASITDEPVPMLTRLLDGTVRSLIVLVCAHLFAPSKMLIRILGDTSCHRHLLLQKISHRTSQHCSL
jgi:alpha-1,2-mannosyltransferase